MSTPPLFLKHLSVALCLLSAGVSLVTAWQIRSSLRGSTYSPVIETRTKVVDAKEPVYRNLVVEESISYAGATHADNYVKTIRGNSYVVSENLTSSPSRYVLYSPFLQDLKAGTKLRGWFVILPATATFHDNSSLAFVAPLELDPIMQDAVKP